MSSLDKRAANGPRDVSGQNELQEKVAELLGYRRDTWSGCWKQPNGYATRWLPDYSNDLNACKILIDLLADKGWTCVLYNGLDKTWECTFETGTSGHKNFKQHYEAADELAVAICRAFVKTMEVRSVPDGNDSSSAGSVSNEINGN